MRLGAAAAWPQPASPLRRVCLPVDTWEGWKLFPAVRTKSTEASPAPPESTARGAGGESDEALTQDSGLHLPCATHTSGRLASPGTPSQKTALSI